MQQSVLIIADDKDFAQTVVARWQSELTVPTFTVMDAKTFENALAPTEELVIFGGLDEGQLATVLGLRRDKPTCICVTATQSQAVSVRKSHPRVLAFSKHEGWVDQLVLLAGEVLRRTEFARRVAETEAELKRVQGFATLGRYMIEMQHGLNNALTSVLGNAELLLLEPGRFSAEMRDQLDTIHSMTLCMHEILQRFSSLENEMKVAEKESHAETAGQSHNPAQMLANVGQFSANATAANGYQAKLK